MSSPSSRLKPRRQNPVWWVGPTVGILLALAAWRVWRDEPAASGKSSPRPEATKSSEISSLTPAAVPTTNATESSVPAAAASASNASQAPLDPRKARPNPWLAQLEAPVRELQAEKDPEKRDQLTQTLSHQITDAEIPGALAALTALNLPEQPEIGRELRRDLIERWAELAPNSASDWLGRMSPGTMRTDSVKTLAQSWAKKDVAAALVWAQGLENGADRESAVVQVAYELARTDPLQALSRAVEIQSDSGREELMDYAAIQWAAKQPEEAAAWARKVEDGDLRQRLLAGIYSAWGDSDPSAAATAAVRSMEAGRDQNDAVVSIVQRWAQREPDIAATWVAAFPESELRDTAAREIVKLWADQSVEKSGAWLNSLEPGSLRDTAVSAYVEQIFPQSPASAVQWAAEIADPAKRQVEFEQLGQSWLEVDATAARAWIQQSSLSAEAKARLLAPVVNPPPATVTKPNANGVNLAMSLR